MTAHLRHDDPDERASAAENDLLARLTAAEPRGSRPLAGLVERLKAVGRLRAVIEPDGRAVRAAC